MRRMVLKYKETEKLLKLVNDKVTDNFDLFEQEANNKSIIKGLKQSNSDLNEKLMLAELQLSK